MEERETPRMHKYRGSKMTRIMMATVCHVTSGSGQNFRPLDFCWTVIMTDGWGQPIMNLRIARSLSNITLNFKWRGNWRMEWVARNHHTSSEHGVSSITTILFILFKTYIPWIIRDKPHLDVGIVNIDMYATTQCT